MIGALELSTDAAEGSREVTYTQRRGGNQYRKNTRRPEVFKTEELEFRKKRGGDNIQALIILIKKCFYGGNARA